MPDRLSFPVRVTSTASPYQPALFGSVTLAVVVGLVTSILMPSTFLRAVLPATSSQLAGADRLSPSPDTMVSAGCVPLTPEPPVSVHVQLTVTSPLCQP